MSSSPVLRNEGPIPLVVQNGLMREDETFFELLVVIRILVDLISVFFFDLEMRLDRFWNLLI